MKPHVWKAYLAFGAVLAVLYGALSPAISKLVIWPIIGWSSVAVIIIGARRNRPDARAPWYWVAAGIATFSMGDDLYSIRNYVQHADALFPSYIDFFYLGVYPLLAIGLASMVRHRTSGRDRASVIDAGIITAGLGLIGWVFLIAPYVRAEDLDTLSRLVSISYPLGDIALLAIAVRLAVGDGRRPAAFWLLAGSIVPLIVADSLFGYMGLAGTWHEHNLVDLGWILFYVGWGAAALHPSMRELTIASPNPRRLSGRRLTIVGSAAIIAPAILFAQQLTGEVRDAAAIAVLGAVTFVLVIVRIAGLAREVATERSEARFRALIDNSSDAILVVDALGAVRYHTPSTERMLGDRWSSLDGHLLSELLEPGDAEQLFVLLAGGMAATTVEWRVRHSDGRWREVEVIAADLSDVSGVDGVVLTMRDITQRMQLNAELQRQSLHDTLTGLPNRALFLDRLGHALTRAEAPDQGVGVLFLDLDDFNVVNETLGHAAGDQMLNVVAARLAMLARTGDTVARFGGDEFALLIEDDDIAAAMDEYAGRVQSTMEEPICIGNSSPIVQGASIGIAVGANADAADDLLRHADVAMYVAKRSGKNRSKTFDPAMYEDARRRLEIASELPEAIANEELVAYYQPIVDVTTGRTLGAEALVRWQHPTRGLLQPVDFIPTAEASGPIVALGQWMLAEACSQTQRWKEQGIASAGFYVTINLSARHIRDPNVVDHVREALRDSGLPPSALVLEVTETTVIEDHSAAGSTLAALRQLGLRIAVDDFGTGFSSLSYLTALPLDIIKIDKSFTDQLALSSEGAAMVRAVVDLAAALELKAVAEGVEEAEQATVLRQLGCPLAQGFLFARPMPSSAMARALAEMAHPVLT